MTKRPVQVHVIGATGRTGVALCRALTDDAVDVVPVVRDPAKNKMIVIPAYEKWVPESERNLGKTAAVG